MRLKNLHLFEPGTGTFTGLKDVIVEHDTITRVVPAPRPEIDLSEADTDIPGEGDDSERLQKAGRRISWCSTKTRWRGSTGSDRSGD